MKVVMEFDTIVKTKKCNTSWRDRVLSQIMHFSPFHLVYADESAKKGGEGDSENGEKSPSISFEDLIAKARKEEKDKLYPDIEKLKLKVSTLTEQHNDDLLKIAEFERQITELNAQLTRAGKNDPKEVAQLKTKLSDVLAANSDLQKKVEGYKDVDEVALRQSIESEIEARYAVKFYRIQKLQEAGDEILIPELVVGDTREAIDASIEAAKARTKELREKLGVKEEKKQPSKKPNNPANPPDKGSQGKEYDMEYIASLDPASPEYAEWRRKMGIK